MRNIISFNESLKYSDIIQEIEYHLIHLSDMGYKIKVKLIKDYSNHIFLNILDYDDKLLSYDEITHGDFERMVLFCEQNNFKLERIYYKEVNDDGRIFNRGDRKIRSDIFDESFIGNKLAFLSFEFKEVERKYI